MANRKKRCEHPCCNNPKQEYHSSWQDETGLCDNCGKRLRYGNGPGPYGSWPTRVKKIRGKEIKMTLVPAYGRDYKSAKEVKAAWEDNKDFLICDISSPDDGRYANYTDIKNSKEVKRVTIRYKKLTQLVVIKVE